MRLLYWLPFDGGQSVLYRYCIHGKIAVLSAVLYLDVNECLQGTAGCNQGCNNTEGSFNCTCYDGYQLHQDDPTLCDGMVHHTV